MKRRRTSWRRPAGVTLIEVLAALALLGLLAVAMLLSRSRLIEQHALAQQKLEAIQVADRLLSEWWTDDLSAFPVDERGDIQGQKGWFWETRPINHESLKPFDTQVVRLRIVDASYSSAPVELTSVEVLVPERSRR